MKKRMSPFLHKQLYGDIKPSLESLKKTEWDKRFEKLMRANLIMSSFRYGLIADAKAYDYVTSMRQRLDLFDETGNAQHLIDIANICMVVFAKKMHSKFHYDHIDDGVHAKKKEF